MKANLLKSLAISSIALVLGVSSLTSCTKPQGPVARTALISEAIAWDSETKAPACNGELLTLKDVVITAQYGANEFSVQNIPASNTDTLYSIEVHFKDGAASTFDVKDIITVTGTVSSYLGHAILADATATWGTEGEEACKGKGGVYYYQDFTRGQWDYNMNRQWSGIYVELNLQFAEIPTLTENTQSEIKFVFPGEDLDLTNENNFFSIDVIVPALSGEHYTKVNTWLSNFEVGDGVRLFFQVYFRNYVGGILPYTSFRFNGTNAPAFLDGVYTAWGNTSTPHTAAYRVSDSFTTNWPSFESSLAYSYVVTEGFEDDETGLPVIVVTAYTYQTIDVMNEILATIDSTTTFNETTKASGWAIVDATETAFAVGYCTYSEEDGAWVVGDYAVVIDNESSVEIDLYIASEDSLVSAAGWTNATTCLQYLTVHSWYNYGIYGFLGTTEAAEYTTGLIAPSIPNGVTLHSGWVDTSYSRIFGTASGIYFYDLYWILFHSESTTAVLSQWLSDLVTASNFSVKNTTLLNLVTGENSAALQCLYNAATGFVVIPYQDSITANDGVTQLDIIGGYVFYVHSSLASEYIK